ncbi:hypothetical protein G6F16_013426 [Rhizopus arrhizus]|nr:hypothetical protein G6F24_013751 [Rhizopus arrhizus]KAG0858269.1 hypothetical protein G6F16_013426 [Rhizopus arrhizus]KAG1390479.1 hypothetical protein G6F60_012969 [Rhizopus arrhizus]
MANKDQSPNTFTHGETDVFRTNIEEASKVIEDTEMANVEETPSLMAASLVSNDDKSVDAVMGLRVHLEELRQQIARAVVSGASQEQAVSIKNCIMFLDEAQAFCVSPPIPTGDIILGPGHATNVSHPRSAHVIPPDLPTWQWQGNIWRKEAEAHDSVEDLLDTFALIVESNGLSVDSSWSRLVPIKMNRDQRSWFNEVLKGRNLVWSEVRKIIVKTYAAQDVAQELEYMDQLLSLKMAAAESIEAFTDRFQRIRRAAKSLAPC